MQDHGRVIVMEDDILISRYFLGFMNDVFDLYEHDQQVASIHGYVYPAKMSVAGDLLSRGADCWGWAAWRRGWELFEPDGRALLQQLRQRDLTQHFDFNGAYPYTRMLEEQIAGKNDSWAVRWYASAFLRTG